MEKTNVINFLSPKVSRARQRRSCSSFDFLGRERRRCRTTMTCPRCSITSFSAAAISIAASKWSKRLPVSAPATGGVHPGRGTRNALLSLGERRYLEVIAPDPAQSEIVHYPQLRSMTDPRLIGWAVHPPDIAAVAKQLRENKVEFKGPDDGSRKRPDGRVLNWKTINLADDRHGLLPFFIEWSADSVHPSKDAPAKCTLDYFEVMSADPEELAAALKRIGLDLPVQRSDKARLHALISGPKGERKAQHLSLALWFLHRLLRTHNSRRNAQPSLFPSCRAAAGACYTLKPVPRRFYAVWGGL